MFDRRDFLRASFGALLATTLDAGEPKSTLPPDGACLASDVNVEIREGLQNVEGRNIYLDEDLTLMSGCNLDACTVIRPRWRPVATVNAEDHVYITNCVFTTEDPLDQDDDGVLVVAGASGYHVFDGGDLLVVEERVRVQQELRGDWSGFVFSGSTANLPERYPNDEDAAEIADLHETCSWQKARSMRGPSHRSSTTIGCGSP